MNNTALLYRSSPFTGLVRHGRSDTPLVRDSDIEAEWRSVTRLELEVQIRSGDYFVNLATVLDALGRNIDEALRKLEALTHFEENGEVCPANWEEGEEGMVETHESVSGYLAKHHS